MDRANNGREGKEMKTKNIGLAILLLGSLLAGGCTFTGVIRNDIAPTAMVGRKNEARVGVYFTPRLANYVETSRPATHAGSAHTYEFQMGPALTAALTRSVEAVYANVFVVPTSPREGEFERVFKFNLQSSNVRIEFVPGYFTTSAKADCILHVSMETTNGSLKAIQRLSINGNGFSNKQTGGVGDEAQRQFSLAIEDAIRQLTENTANLLVAGVGERGTN